MVAKVIPPNKEPFYVLDGREITDAPGFNTLNGELQKQLEWLGVFGTKDGFKITALGSREEGAIDVTKNGISFEGAQEEQWVGVKFRRKPVSVVFMEDGTVIEPVNEVEMKAEIATRSAQKER